MLICRQFATVPTQCAAAGEVLDASGGLSDFTGENTFAAPADVLTTVDVLRHLDAIPACGAVEMVDVEVVLAATECQHGTNLFPIGSSPMLSSFPTFVAVCSEPL